jgi:diguanylate cyclase (GGDEF)-like protein/PAS domain S-box-containing protein
MSLKKLAAQGRDEKEIAKLLDVLRETGKRLEALTSGEVDTATDPEGRILLLRGTREQLKRNEAIRQAAILNALPAHIALLDPDGTIVSVNNCWKLFVGVNSMRGGPGQGLGVNYLAVCDRATGPGSHETHLAADGIRSVLNGSSKSFSFDYESNSSAEERWFQLTVTPLSTDRPKGVVVIHANISTSKRNQLELVSFAERLSLATAVAKVGVWDWELATDVHTWDATMSAIYGFPAADQIDSQKWSSSVHPEDLAEAEMGLRNAVDTKGDGATEFRIILADGTQRNISAVFRAVLDASGKVIRVIGVNVDVTERKNADEELHSNQAIITHLAEHDFLTDLPNQRVLRDRIDQAIKMASRNMKQFAILFLDLDGFKHINDSLGHPIGDKLLLSIAKRLIESARASDTVCRFGGDEFIMLLPEVQHPEGTGSTALRMLEAIAAVHFVDELELQVTASIGISVYPDDGMDGETLIKNADAAMYHAKGRGGSNFQFFHPDMNIRAIERQFIEQNLRRAMERHELAVHYQPKYDLKSRAITGVEALLRWTHPVRGPISPVAFIPVAEDCGLILPIGTWVLEESCRQARAWLDAGLPELNVAVNVSGRQFQSEYFEEKVLAILDEFCIGPEYLELEVTESLLMKNPEHTAPLLQSLRQKGIRVAIDDFGTGYSSLSYLHRFPIDTLKIDQSFVRQIDTSDGVSMVKAIIHLGRELGLRIVAEGVESEREAAILETMDCDSAQGYYFSRPLAPENLATLLEARSSAV